MKYSGFPHEGKVSGRLYWIYSILFLSFLQKYTFLLILLQNNKIISVFPKKTTVVVAEASILDQYWRSWIFLHLLFISDRVVFTLELSIILCFGIPPIFKKNNLSKIIISNPYYIYQGSGFFIFLRVVYFHPFIFLPHSNSTQY